MEMGVEERAKPYPLTAEKELGVEELGVHERAEPY